MFPGNLAQVCSIIDPGKRPSGRTAYPPRWSIDSGLRIAKKETVHQWFERCVDQLFAGEPDHCAVEENLALFLVLKWKEQEGQRLLTYANCQALWTEAKLADFYLDGTVRHQYLRLDFDPAEALGPMFKEPLPHVHVVPEGAPRFSIPIPASGDVVGEFLDFVYRNYFYAQWQVWAKDAHETARRERDPAKESQFDVIAAAYAANKTQILATTYRDELIAIKQCLAQKRAKFFGINASRELCQLLSHGE